MKTILRTAAYILVARVTRQTTIPLSTGRKAITTSVVVLIGSLVSAPASALPSTDLSKLLSTRAPWRIDVSQGPSTEDMGGNPAPGAIRLCLRAAPSGACDPALLTRLRDAGPDDAFAEPHYLSKVRVVYPTGPNGPSLVLIVTASLHAGDGGQVILTQGLAYRRAVDRFVRVYAHDTGSNNDQETRYVEDGRLRGDIISVEPTADAPYGFWITVSEPKSQRAYQQVLHYRSATRYGDGNPLAVIDSELPNLERRLHIWRSGPLPLPNVPCARPHLLRIELWCR